MRRASFLPVAALAAALIATPVAAAETPDAAVTGLLEIIAAKEFERIPELVCAERAEEVAADFDLVGEMAESGIDGQAILDAITIAASDVVTEVLSDDGTNAVVQVTGTLTMTVDEAAFRTVMEAFVEEMGIPVDSPEISAAIDSALAEMSQSEPIEGEIDVLLEDGTWKICGDISAITDGGDAEASFVPEPTDDGVLGAFCSLATLEEVSALGIELTEVADDGSDLGCTWSTPMDQMAYAALTVYEQTGSAGDLSLFFDDEVEVTVAGRNALYVPSVFGVFIDLAEDRVLVVQSVQLEASEDELQAYVLAAAELFTPRIP